MCRTKDSVDISSVTADRLVILSLIAVTILVGGGLRFYRLGSWSFTGDEYATIGEARSLLGRDEGTTAEDQSRRLPRLIPLSYALLSAGHAIFGTDEFGARIVPALAGALNAALVLVLLAPTLGRLPATIASVLLATWPEHIYFSQNHRYYTIAFGFSTVMIAGADRSVSSAGLRWPATFLLAGLAAIASHTATIVLFEAALVALLAARVATGRSIRDRTSRLLLLGSILIDLIAVARYLEFGMGWNGGEAWGYGTMHSILGAANSLGWPILLLACIGCLTTIRRMPTEGVYWVALSVMGALAIAILPRFIVYNPAYSFLFLLSPIVLAGAAIAELGRRSRSYGRPTMWVVIVSSIGLSAPSIVSYYQDGSRLDLRSASRFVERHWKSGDRVVSFSPGLFRHYAPGCPGVIPIRMASLGEQMESLLGSPGRLWLVVPVNRAGLAEEVRGPLESRAHRAAVFEALRFDYQVNKINIYLVRPGRARGPARCLIVRPHVVPICRLGSLRLGVSIGSDRYATDRASPRGPPDSIDRSERKCNESQPVRSKSVSWLTASA